MKAKKKVKTPLNSNTNPPTDVSIKDPANQTVKTSGIKVRGTGAATKGTLARGPMA